MATRKVKLPANWTPAQVRVLKNGKVQLKINPAKLGSGGRFAKCVQSVEAEGGAMDARAVCAAAGRKKYAIAKAGKRRRNTRHKPVARRRKR